MTAAQQLGQQEKLETERPKLGENPKQIRRRNHMCSHHCLREQETMYRTSAPLEDRRLTNEAEQLAAKVCRRRMLRGPGNRPTSGALEQKATAKKRGAHDPARGPNENQRQ
jgi:hypothetical protein